MVEIEAAVEATKAALTHREVGTNNVEVVITIVVEVITIQTIEEVITIVRMIEKEVLTKATRITIEEVAIKGTTIEEAIRETTKEMEVKEEESTVEALILTIVAVVIAAEETLLGVKTLRPSAMLTTSLHSKTTEEVVIKTEEVKAKATNEVAIKVTTVEEVVTNGKNKATTKRRIIEEERNSLALKAQGASITQINLRTLSSLQTELT